MRLLTTLAAILCASTALALPPFDASAPKTMGVGYVVPMANYYAPCMVYADMMKQSSDWNGQGTLDPDGWPTSTQPGGIFAILSQPADNGIDDRGLPNAPWGRYTLVFDTPDGQGDAWLSSAGGDAYAEDEAARSTSGNVNRTRVFDFTGSPSGKSAPFLTAWTSGNVRNIRVYPPGAATDGSQLFHPAYLAMLGGATNLRTEAFVQANPSCVVDYSDFPSTTARSYAATYGWPTVAVASMAPTGDDFGFFTGGRGVFLVTTATPHNLKTGHVVQFSTGSAATRSDGSTFSLQFFSPTVYVIDPSTFACSIPGAPLASISADTAASIVRRRDTSPPEHAVALANAVPGAALHLNVPQALSDDAAAVLFRMIAASLAPGRSLRVELSNEPWNTAYPYEQSAYFGYLGRQRGGLDPTQAYAQRSSEIHAAARGAFVAAGRPATQVIGVFNTMAFAGPGSPVDILLSYCKAPTDPRSLGEPIAVDELACAAYYSASYLGDGPEYDAWTVDQAAANALSSIPGATRQRFLDLRSWADGLGFRSTRIIAYEAGPRTLFAGGSTYDTLARQSQGVNLSPASYALTLAMLQEAQDAGCSCYTKQGLVSDATSDTGDRGSACYMAYYGLMAAGIGDGSDGLADNRPILAAMAPGRSPDYARMVSPVGAAINRWNALVRSGAVVATTTPAPPPVVTPPPAPPTTTPAPVAMPDPAADLAALTARVSALEAQVAQIQAWARGHVGLNPMPGRAPTNAPVPPSVPVIGR